MTAIEFVSGSPSASDSTFLLTTVSVSELQWKFASAFAYEMGFGFDWEWASQSGSASASSSSSGLASGSASESASHPGCSTDLEKRPLKGFAFQCLLACLFGLESASTTQFESQTESAFASG